MRVSEAWKRSSPPRNEPPMESWNGCAKRATSVSVAWTCAVDCGSRTHPENPIARMKQLVCWRSRTPPSQDFSIRRLVILQNEPIRHVTPCASC